MIQLRVGRRRAIASTKLPAWRRHPRGWCSPRVRSVVEASGTSCAPSLGRRPQHGPGLPGRPWPGLGSPVPCPPADTLTSKWTLDCGDTTGLQKQGGVPLHPQPRAGYHPWWPWPPPSARGSCTARRRRAGEHGRGPNVLSRMLRAGSGMEAGLRRVDRDPKRSGFYHLQVVVAPV